MISRITTVVPPQADFESGLIHKLISSRKLNKILRGSFLIKRKLLSISFLTQQPRTVPLTQLMMCLTKNENIFKTIMPRAQVVSTKRAYYSCTCQQGASGSPAILDIDPQWWQSEILLNCSRVLDPRGYSFLYF